MGITIEDKKEVGIVELDGLNTYFGCLVSFIQSKILRYKLANFKEIRALLHGTEGKESKRREGKSSEEE